MIEPLNNDVVDSARNWIGTPYKHQASTFQQGADCLGLIRGVWRDLIGAEPEKPPNYTKDWSETGRAEVLLDAASRHLSPAGQIDLNRPGTVLLFRMIPNSVAKHLGILGQSPDGYPTLIHAYSGYSVTETALTTAWIRRISAQFHFPERRQ